MVQVLPYTARLVTNNGSGPKGLDRLSRSTRPPSARRLQESGSGYALEHETIEGTTKERP
jgi:hypothetical protein